MKEDDFSEFIEELTDVTTSEDWTDENEQHLSEVPNPTDEGWYDFLIDNLYENELIQGNPTVDGLRRLTEKFFGEIIKSKSSVVETEHDGDGLRCTVKHTLVIRKYKTNTMIDIDACIDVDYRSVPHPFNKHIVATADTRAEGKALRRALKLRVVTAEEVQTQHHEDEVFAKDGINDQQIMAIGAVCRKYNINVEKVAKSVYNNIKTLKQLTNLEASMLLDKITAYQREKEIPEELLGYNPSWQSSF